MGAAVRPDHVSIIDVQPPTGWGTAPVPHTFVRTSCDIPFITAPYCCRRQLARAWVSCVAEAPELHKVYAERFFKTTAGMNMGRVDVSMLAFLCWHGVDDEPKPSKTALGIDVQE